MTSDLYTSAPQAYKYQGPQITAQRVIEGLVDNGTLDQRAVIEMLGEARNDISLNELEMILNRRGVISDHRLLQLKGALAGLNVFDRDATTEVDTSMPVEVVRHYGAFKLKRDVPTVAMVEDLPASVSKLVELLGVQQIEVQLITAAMFDELYRFHYEQDESARLPQPGSIYTVLDEAVRRRASDIHLSVGIPPSFRVDGGLLSMKTQPITSSWLERELEHVCGADRMSEWRRTSNVDLAYTYGKDRFRVNLGADRYGMTAALRKIPTEIPSMDALGLPEAIRNLCNLERGLILVCGPTGSGKSTTLASMLAHIASTQERHIITLEDPIEFFLPSGKSVVHQRELGQSFDGFTDGLRQALRQDPDVVLVGEMRDLETIETAIHAAETGHLVLGTLHTFDAPSTVARIVSSFPAGEQDQVRSQLAYILKGVVAQSLIPLANSSGRVAAFEIMISNPAVQNNLRKLNGHAQLRQSMETGASEGMRTMDMSLVDLLQRGLIRLADAEHRAPNKEAFEERRRSVLGDTGDIY